MRRILALALGLVVTGCGSSTTSPATTPSPPPPSTDASAQPAHGEDVQGRFRLVFELPRTTWRATETITGEATLSLNGVGGAELRGSGSGLLGFEFLEVGGRRHVVPASTLDCVPYRLDAGQPIVSPITKSGGYSADQPDADFFRSFLSDPLVRLPPGDWRITAGAEFVDGSGCQGPDYEMRATVLVHVTP